MTVLLSAIATFSLGGVMSYTLADGLYESRLETALEDTSSAVNTVNRTLAGAAVSDETTLQTLLNSLVPTLEEAGSRKVALLRSPGQPQLQLLQSPVSADLDFQVIPDDLREAVRASGNQLSYKPIELVNDATTTPGLIVGAPVDVPLAGQFELFLVFDLQGFSTDSGLCAASCDYRWNYPAGHHRIRVIFRDQKIGEASSQGGRGQRGVRQR